MEGNLLLNQQLVQSEVESINRLANDVERDSQQLLEVARKCVNSGIQTDWGVAMMQQLQQFQGTQMADAIAEIKLQARKLEEASISATAYSQGQI